MLDCSIEESLYVHSKTGKEKYAPLVIYNPCNVDKRVFATQPEMSEHLSMKIEEVIVAGSFNINMMKSTELVFEYFTTIKSNGLDCRLQEPRKIPSSDSRLDHFFVRSVKNISAYVLVDQSYS